ncbi:condensin complex subunit 1-like [Schistocerca gregaria]|uniref:condensin complex subunit 1-like n=1 Tax=Schistocerca gregaria TaxID=7010 RepID=UPI00211E58D2|nr:condensin complex subunit 1-like [Schistocerca gregaria]
MDEQCIPEFHIPSSADDLTSDRWKNAGRYTVENVLGIGDLPGKLAECREAMHDVGMLFVLDHFDSLFSVIVHFRKLEWSVLTKAWGAVMQAFRISVKELDKTICDSMEADKQHKYRNASKMMVYLLTQYIKGFEDRLAGCGKGKNKISKVSESKDWNWKERNHEALIEIYNCLQLPLQNLWDPAVCEEPFSDIIGNACFKSLEDPGVTQVKMKPMCETIFQIIGTLVKKHGYGFSCIVRIGQMLHIHEHMVSPMVRCVVVLFKEFKCTRIVHEILQEISRIDTEVDADSEEPAAGVGVAKTYGQFIAELAESVPELVLPHIDLLKSLLDVKAYVMRNSVLSAYSIIVQKCLSGEDLSEEERNKRDDLLCDMEDHIHDVNAFVRSRVLQLWQNLVKEHAVPISFHASVLERAVGRLHDKSAFVKKSAVQLVASFLEQNPFASRLGLEELQAQLESEEKKLQAIEDSTAKLPQKVEEEWNELEPDLKEGLTEVLEADDTSTDMECDEIDFAEQCGLVCKLVKSKDYKSAYQQLRSLEEKLPAQVHCLKNSVDIEELHDNCVKLFRKIHFMYHGEPEESEESKELKRVIAFLKDSIAYVELMNKALPVICSLLTSMQTTDIVEAIEFITSAYQFGLSQAENSMRELLTLVLSGNESVLSAVSEAYYQVYLKTEETDSRKHSEIVVKNLCHLVSTINAGQKAALDSLLLEWLKKGYITPGDIQIMWEWVAMAEPEISAEDSRHALVLLDILAVEKSDMMKTRLPFLLAACLGERGQKDFLLVTITCRLIAKSHRDSERLPEDHVMFSNLCKILREGFPKKDCPNYVVMAEAAIELIYQLSMKPVAEMESLVINLSEQLQNCNLNTDSGSESGRYPAEVLSRFLFVVGHICLRHMIHLEEYVYIKLRKIATKNKRKSKASDTSKSREGSPSGTQAEDNEYEQIRMLCEKHVVTGTDMLALCSKFVVDICSKPKEYDGTSVLTSAFLALSKMMVVSSEFCAEHIQLFMTALKTSTDEKLRANCLIAFGDIAFRFPNVAEPWTGYICDSLRDTTSDTVRQTAVLILTHLVMNDMVKIRTQIADIALCLTDAHPEISYTAKVFFYELSQKGNALYNTLPEIISKLTHPETNLDDSKFRTILKFILGLIHRERQLETLIEKLCQRLGAASTEQQAANLAFCMSLLTYNEKSLYLLIENLKCYADKLHHKPVFDYFMNIVSSSMKNPKQEIKAVSSELESYIQDIVNGTGEKKQDGDEQEPDRPPRTTKTPYRRRGTRQAPSTVKKQPQKGKTPRRRKPKTPSSTSESSDLEE